MSCHNILYRYAVDSEGVVVDINNLRLISKSERFRCIECNGRLIPKIGKIKAPHFAHYRSTSCSSEGYLHRLAKYFFVKRFKEALERRGKLSLVYQVKIYCDYFSHDFPGFSCVEKRLASLNLADYFDIIETETIYKGFRADVLLRSSKMRESALMIEFKVSNAISEDKKNSGIPIIEIERL